MTSAFYSVSVTLLARIEQMQIVRDALDSLAVANAIPNASTARLQIVLDELISNAIKHGASEMRPTGGEAKIEVAMLVEDSVFTLCLTDDGPGFDPTQLVYQTDTSRPRIGGRGLDMVRALTDSMSYLRVNGKNQTIVTKAIEQRHEGRAPMISGLQIEETREADTATVALAGRIDSGNASQVTEHLSGLVAAGHHQVTLDMAKLDYLTSAGFRTLLLVSDAAEEAGGGLTLRSLTEEVRELFDLSGLSRAFVIK